MKNILFICTGNICRSPMAEGLMREAVKGLDMAVASAGLGAAHGQPPSPHSIDVMEELGIDISKQRSQSVTPELVNEASAIFVMTYGHLDMMLMLFPGAADKTFLIREFEQDFSNASREIADPIGSPIEVYRAVRDQIQAALPSLIHYMKNASLPESIAKDHHARIQIALGADHHGVEVKQELRSWLEEEGYHVTDFGPDRADAVDYPDYATKVAHAVAVGETDFGVLICGSGIGMSIAANKVPGVRAALVHEAETAKSSREHNNANVLCLAAREVKPRKARELLKLWLQTSFAGGRHERRLEKIEAASVAGSRLAVTDPEIAEVIQAETLRQSQNIELIASENFTSKAVMEAQGSVLTNKYAEGYPGKRWYGGCEHVDVAERLAIDRAKTLFGAEHANVQPHSGSQANMAVYFSVLQPGDKIMTMDLSHGGHLTHGHPKNFSGMLYQVIHYGVSSETETIHYDELEKMAREHKPKMITAGASAYSRIIDFKRMREIADAVGAYLFVDMAHIAGLVAGGEHPSPVPFADFVTTTTHKTLRGPRGGLVLCKQAFADGVDSKLFPGTQGGPLMHVIAAKAVCFLEALQPGFREYQNQVVRNAKALCEGMKKNGYRIVSGATENHVMLVDLQPKEITGRDASTALDAAGITVNKNAIPFDKQSPLKAGGIRLGSPAVTTRGFKEEEMFEVADLIHAVLADIKNPEVARAVRSRVLEMTSRFPMPH